ncbi:MAG: hypothetical protein R2861_01265 [Desulfobacterales bacterium]
MLFAGVCFLGVMVGRNTAPVQFDVEEIEEKLSKLQGISVLNQENAEKPPAPEAGGGHHQY